MFPSAAPGTRGKLCVRLARSMKRDPQAGCHLGISMLTFYQTFTIRLRLERPVSCQLLHLLAHSFLLHGLHGGIPENLRLNYGRKAFLPYTEYSGRGGPKKTRGCNLQSAAYLENYVRNPRREAYARGDPHYIQQRVHKSTTKTYQGPRPSCLLMKSLGVASRSTFGTNQEPRGTNGTASAPPTPKPTTS